MCPVKSVYWPSSVHNQAKYTIFGHSANLLDVNAAFKRGSDKETKYPKLGHFAPCVPFGEARALSSETEPREMGKELAFLETRHDLRRYP